jgi:hypothetical protein
MAAFKGSLRGELQRVNQGLPTGRSSIDFGRAEGNFSLANVLAKRRNGDNREIALSPLSRNAEHIMGVATTEDDLAAQQNTGLDSNVRRKVSPSLPVSLTRNQLPEDITQESQEVETPLNQNDLLLKTLLDRIKIQNLGLPGERSEETFLRRKSPLQELLSSIFGRRS